jgi:hypothetical protein
VTGASAAPGGKKRGPGAGSRPIPGGGEWKHGGRGTGAVRRGDARELDWATTRGAGVSWERKLEESMEAVVRAARQREEADEVAYLAE